MTLLPFKVTLSHWRAKELLNYNKHTGALTWRVDKGRLKAGDDAGTVRKDKTIMVTIDRKQNLATRLVWFYVHGKWPVGRVTTHNGDSTDLRWTNIMLESSIYANTPGAAYQREYRARVAALKRGEDVGYPKLALGDPRSREHVMRARHEKPSIYDVDSGYTNDQIREIVEHNRRVEETLRIAPRKRGRPKGSKNKPKLPKAPETTK